MLSNIFNATNLLYLGVGIAYFVLSFLIIRSVKKGVKKPTFEHTYLLTEDSEYDYEVTSNPCPLCNRIDIIHITKELLLSYMSRSKVGVGKFILTHDDKYGDHTITHYFDKSGDWIGDFIPSHYLVEALEERELMQ